MMLCPISYDHSGDGGQVAGDPVERCRIPSTVAHAIHVSAHGFYRWDDSGVLVATPHWSSPEFAALYADTPPPAQT